MSESFVNYAKSLLSMKQIKCNRITTQCDYKMNKYDNNILVLKQHVRIEVVTINNNYELLQQLNAFRILIIFVVQTATQSIS